MAPRTTLKTRVRISEARSPVDNSAPEKSVTRCGLMAKPSGHSSARTKRIDSRRGD